MSPGDPAESKIRLMVVSGTLAGGGAERFVSNFLCNLDRTRFDASLLLLRNEIGYPIPADIPRIVVDYVGLRSTVGTIRRIRTAIDRVKPGVILSNMDSNGKFVGAALRTTSTQPVWIARTSNDPVQKYKGFRGSMNELWLRKVYPRADYFVANSEGLAESFRRFFPFAANKTRVIGNPVDLGQIDRLASLGSDKSPATKDPVIVFLGRLDNQKRPDILLRAFQKILKQRRAKLLICGDGPLRGEVDSLVARYELGDSVEVLGFCDNPFPILLKATLVLVTSDFEGLPNVVLEAQALGIPVVATDCGFGPAEIIDHESTGLLTEIGQPAAIADAAEQILSSPDRRHRMSVAAREKVRREYGAERIMGQWMNFFKEATSDRSVFEFSTEKFDHATQPTKSGNEQYVA